MVKERSSEIETRINFKLKQFENTLVKHIDEKLNNITERIIGLSTNSFIEKKVNKRLDEKLEKIRKQL